ARANLPTLPQTTCCIGSRARSCHAACAFCTVEIFSADGACLCTAQLPQVAHAVINAVKFLLCTCKRAYTKNENERRKNFFHKHAIFWLEDDFKITGYKFYEVRNFFGASCCARGIFVASAYM